MPASPRPAANAKFQKPQSAPEGPGSIHVYLDMDGVLTDFDPHALAHGKYKPDGKLDWDALDYKWWTTLPVCAGAKEFYDDVKGANLGRVKFLTAPVPGEDCFAGKANWLMNFVPERGRFILLDLMICHATEKQLIARPNHILIDDRIKNVGEWRAAGGIGIHHDGDFTATRKKLAIAVAQLRALPGPKHVP